MLQGGPHRHLARSVRVRDFMEASEPAPPPPAEEPRLAPDDMLERALKLFDATGEPRIAVVASGPGGPRLVGHASQVRALSHFNAALIEVSREEHR
jgi:CIC family chloride channel protein